MTLTLLHAAATFRATFRCRRLRRVRTEAHPPPAPTASVSYRPHALEFDLGTFLMVAPILLFSMTAHEWAHGYAALKQGDPTAYQLGYVTWNPIKYVDPIMTIIVPIISFFVWHFPFGGMRSGPINSRNFRKFKRGDIIVSLAGVTANFVLMFIFALIFALLGILGRVAPGAASPLSTLQAMAGWGMFLNIILVGINTLPLPPFDGSVLPRHLLPPAWAAEYQKLQPYGFFIMMFVFTIGSFILNAWMRPFMYIYRTVMMSVVGLGLDA